MLTKKLRKRIEAHFSDKGFRHCLGIALLALFLFFASVIAIYIGVVKTIDALRPPPFKDGRVILMVSRETTYVEGPVREDGTVDYAPHLLAGQKKLPPEKNAVFYLIKALGPQIYESIYYEDKKKKGACFLLYSFGPDKKDDGGDPDSDIAVTAD